MTLLKKTDSGFYMHWCEGCQSRHMIAVEEPLSNKARWVFNGDLEKPTFTPSVRVRWPGGCCHYFITDGQIIYLSDCTHSLAGKTVPLQSLPRG